MSDVFHIELPDGRVVGIEASSPQEAAQGARNIVAREKGEKAGTAGGAGYVDNLVRSGARGASFGLADEIAAAGDATVGPILDLILGKLGLGKTNTSTAGGWSARYGENLGRERAQDRTFDAENPVASTTGKLAGGVAGAIATLPRAILQTPTLLRSAGAGATIGGAAGFGEGEGGIVPRLESAAEGAGVGAVLGPAFQLGIDKVGAPATRALLTSKLGQGAIGNVISPAARKVADILDLIATRRPALSGSAAAPEGGSGLPSGLLADIADAVRSVPSGEDVVKRAAAERLATGATRAKMSSDQMKGGLTDVGDVGMLADIDPQFMSMARVAQTMPGETKSFAPKVLDERAKGAGPRLRGAFEGDQPPPSDFALMGPDQGFDSYRRAVGGRVYDAMDAAGLKQSPELMKLYENPVVDRAINKVMSEETATRTGTSRPPASPIDIMHKVKQEIQDMGVAETGRGSSTQSYYRDLAGEYVRALKTANPKLAEADAAYSAAASLPEFYQAGAGSLRGGLTDTARKSGIGALDDILGGADPLQVLSARAGVTNAAREETGGKIARAIGLARLIEESPDMRTKMVQLYGGDRAQEIFRAAQAELRMNKTRGDILSGSQTTNKAAELFDSGLDTGNLGVRVSPGGIVPRFVQHFSDIARRVTAPNEAVRNEIGRMTLNPDQVKNLEVIELIDQILRQRARGRTAPASTGGVLGGQIPGLTGP